MPPLSVTSNQVSKKPDKAYLVNREKRLRDLCQEYGNQVAHHEWMHSQQKLKLKLTALDRKSKRASRRPQDLERQREIYLNELSWVEGRILIYMKEVKQLVKALDEVDRSLKGIPDGVAVKTEEELRASLNNFLDRCRVEIKPRLDQWLKSNGNSGIKLMAKVPMLAKLVASDNPIQRPPPTKLPAACSPALSLKSTTLPPAAEPVARTAPKHSSYHHSDVVSSTNHHDHRVTPGSSSASSTSTRMAEWPEVSAEKNRKDRREERERDGERVRERRETSVERDRGDRERDHRTHNDRYNRGAPDTRISSSSNKVSSSSRREYSPDRYKRDREYDRRSGHHSSSTFRQASRERYSSHQDGDRYREDRRRYDDRQMDDRRRYDDRRDDLRKDANRTDGRHRDSRTSHSRSNRSISPPPRSSRLSADTSTSRHHSQPEDGEIAQPQLSGYERAKLEVYDKWRGLDFETIVAREEARQAPFPYGRVGATARNRGVRDSPYGRKEGRK